jgi:hypothetical protein
MKLGMAREVNLVENHEIVELEDLDGGLHDDKALRKVMAESEARALDLDNHTGIGRRDDVDPLTGNQTECLKLGAQLSGSLAGNDPTVLPHPSLIERHDHHPLLRAVS